MKKLNLLKGIVDFVWIMSLISIPFLIVFLAYVLISNEPLGMPIKINGTELNVIDLNSKIILFFLMISSALLLYSLFLFRKILRFFQKRIMDEGSGIVFIKKLCNCQIITHGTILRFHFYGLLKCSDGLLEVFYFEQTNTQII